MPDQSVTVPGSAPVLTNSSATSRSFVFVFELTFVSSRNAWCPLILSRSG